MSTGILSVGFATLRRDVMSMALLLCSVAWAALGVLFLTRLALDRRGWLAAALDRRGWLAAARTPAGLTAVAGIAVIAARLATSG